MRGGTSTAQRMSAALTIRGEGITVLNATIIAPNFNPLSVIPGPLPNPNAETAFYENSGLIIMGNGDTVDGGDFWVATGGP